MNHYITLDGDINEEMVAKLLAKIEMTPKGEDKLVVYLTSQGGNVDDMYTMLHALAEEKDTIKLVACGYIESAALYLFFMADCPKDILQETYGMIHQATTTYKINERGRPYSKYDAFIKEQAYLYTDLFKGVLDSFDLTTDEIRAFEENECTFITNSRLKEAYERYRKASFSV